MAVTWHVQMPAVGGEGEVAVGLSTRTPSLGLCRHLRGGAAMVVVGGCGLVVVRSRGVMGQCLAMGGCQTLKLLIIKFLINMSIQL